jgi:hypothetical protein
MEPQGRSDWPQIASRSLERGRRAWEPQPTRAGLVLCLSVVRSSPYAANVADDTRTETGAEDSPPPVYLSNCDPGDESDEPAEQAPLAA